MADQEQVEQTEQTEAPKRKRVDDQTFFQVNERVANDSTIKSGHIQVVADELGLTKGSVTQRRSSFNATYADHGLKLTQFPKGGGRKKDVDAIAAELLAMRGSQEKAEQPASE